MIRSLELENFKAFGERAKIPFAPITLIFGENSAGKSTILQSLNLLKQTAESREVGALLLPRAENGIVDLGSFQELLFDHDLKRTLSIRVEADGRDSFRRSRYRAKRVSVEFHFKRPTIDDEVLLDQMEIYYGEPAECVAKFKRLESIGELSTPLFGSFSKLTFVKCVWVTKSAQYWKPEFEWCKENLEDIRSRQSDRKEHLQKMLEKRTDEKQNDDEGEWIKEEVQERGGSFPRDLDTDIRDELDPLRDEFDFFSSEFSLEDYIFKRREQEKETVLGLEGFFPTMGFFPMVIRIKSDGEIIMGSDSRSSTKSLMWQEPDNTVFDVADCTMVAKDALEQTLKVLFPMGPFRRPPERWYIFTGTSPQDVGYQGDMLPDLLFRRPDLVKNTNEWLERLDIGYKLDVESVGVRSNDLFEVRLIDTRRDNPVNVALPDVGFGISQLLPFVVQSLASERRIISIEQPEVHVHPRLQADLGDLLAEAIKEPRHNRFIVETHSEHLILRLQRLVYEKRITPEDISVIYVSRGQEGAQAQRLRLDEEGDFIDEWPNGFFPERIRELR